ncbi:hypothetical protein ACHWQZ_G007871 [Mnemiopsis leidyi]
MNVPTEIVKNLYIGNEKCAIQSTLLFNGIVSVMLTTPEKVKNLTNCRTLSVNLNDTVHDNIRIHFEEVSDFIEHIVSNGGSVLVHCKMGVSRSCAVILGYLMKCKHMTLLEAYNLVRSKRKTVRPNDGFWRQLIAYEKELFKGNTSVSFISLPDGACIPSVYETEYRNMVFL